MLENRSFDHMLGYLSLEDGRTDIDGLKAGMSNSHSGKNYAIRHLQRTALTKPEDPCHGGACIAEQIANGMMSGFVNNFVKSRPQGPASGPADGLLQRQRPLRSTTTSRASSASVTAGLPPCPAQPGRTASTPSPAAPPAAKTRRKSPIYDLPSFARHLDTQQGLLALVHA